MKSEIDANEALRHLSAREQARREWGAQQGRYPLPPDCSPMTLKDSLWYWSASLVPLLLVGAFAVVAWFEPGWLVALAEYVK